jgi:hypothetical protein
MGLLGVSLKGCVSILDAYTQTQWASWPSFTITKRRMGSNASVSFVPRRLLTISPQVLDDSWLSGSAHKTLNTLLGLNSHFPLTLYSVAVSTSFRNSPSPHTRTGISGFDQAWNAHCMIVNPLLHGLRCCYIFVARTAFIFCRSSGLDILMLQVCHRWGCHRRWYRVVEFILPSIRCIVSWSCSTLVIKYLPAALRRVLYH